MKDWIYDPNTSSSRNIWWLCKGRPVTWRNWSLTDAVCEHLYFCTFWGAEDNNSEYPSLILWWDYAIITFPMWSWFWRGHFQLWIRQPDQSIWERLQTFPAQSNPEEASVHGTQVLHRSRGCCSHRLRGEGALHSAAELQFLSYLILTWHYLTSESWYFYLTQVLSTAVLLDTFLFNPTTDASKP